MNALNFWDYYLHNPQKPYLRTRFIFITILYLIVFSLQGLPFATQTTRIVIGAVMTIISMVVSFAFGYLGMILALLFNSLGLIMILQSYYQTRDLMSLAVSSFVVGTLIGVAIIAYSSEKARRKQSILEWTSVVDGLTEAYNHRYYQQRLEEELARAQRENTSLGLLMIDLDNFKSYNDSYGHKQGDVLLKKAAALLRSEVRGHDVVCRYGGDEFAIILPNTGKEATTMVANRLKKAFQAMVERMDDVQPRELHMSIGVSVYPELAENLEELMAQADRALYQAKHLGRDNVQIYRDVFQDLRKDIHGDDNLLVGSFKALLGVVSAKDKYTLGHSERVSSYVTMIGEQLNLPPEAMNTIKFAALLHDIGKIEIPESILNKKEALTKSEREIIKQHPVHSANILAPLGDMEKMIRIVKHHHERYDGSGYPDCLGSGEIPVGARILAVADSYDAMLSNRPYRRSMSKEEAKRELVENAGTQFDPAIVEAFIQCI